MSSGMIREKNKVDVELIKSLVDMSEKSLNFIEKNKINIDKKSYDWTFIFRDYYESLRNLIEAFLLFDRIQSENHKCKNTYICFKYPELELNWKFLEAIRLKRNSVNYEGKLLTYSDWKSFELEFNLHIKKLQEEIKKRL